MPRESAITIPSVVVDGDKKPYISIFFTSMESSVFPMQIMLVCPQHVFINTLTTQWVNKGVPSLVQLSLRVDSCEHAASLMIFMKVNVSLH